MTLPDLIDNALRESGYPHDSKERRAVRILAEALEQVLRCFNAEGKHIAGIQGGNPDQFEAVKCAREALATRNTSRIV